MSTTLLAVIILIPASLVAALNGKRAALHVQSPTKHLAATSRVYLGFDRNDYPGDPALISLKKTFSFAGYWLNNPPGASSNTWLGKRKILKQRGFGFLILFNGRTYSQLKSPHQPGALGAGDARAAAESARQQGFPANAIIFLDQEEGGKLLPEQESYVLAWIDGVIATGFRAGVYCSGMPASEGSGKFVVTADYIRNRAAGREISFFVYGDACPPSPGCAYAEKLPAPTASGVKFASIWQFAQSPRRREFTGRCASTYARNGSCYPPASGAGSIFVDLDSATSPDPSQGR